jgi:hypothetical protein
MHTLPERRVTITTHYLRTLLPAAGIISWPLRKTFPIESFGEITEAFIGGESTTD